MMALTFDATSALFCACALTGIPEVRCYTTPTRYVMPRAACVTLRPTSRYRPMRQRTNSYCYPRNNFSGEPAAAGSFGTPLVPLTAESQQRNARCAVYRPLPMEETPLHNYSASAAELFWRRDSTPLAIPRAFRRSLSFVVSNHGRGQPFRLVAPESLSAPDNSDK